MMMKFLIYFLYRPFFVIIKSLVPLFKSRFDEKTLAWFKLRDEENTISFSSTDNVFWFHASSGEIEYAKALIRELKKAQPQATVVVTYSSPSAIRLFENIKPLVNQFIPLPWDQPKPLVKLINQLNPKTVIFARTDLWPELIFQLKQKNIPTFVASYNPSLSNGNRFFIGTFLNHFAGIFCVHPTQESVLHSIVRKEVYVSSPGDTRFDQVFWRLAQPSKSPITFDFKYGVLGSTWPEDEKIILPVL